MSFQNVIGGHSPFYDSPNYREQILKDFKAPLPPSPPVYVYREDPIILRVAKNILESLSFAFVIYGALHFVAKKIVSLPLATSLNQYQIWNVVKWIFIPIVLFRLFHAAVAIGILPAWVFKFARPFSPLLKDIFEEVSKVPTYISILEEGWVFRRVAIDCDGTWIDATIIGRATTLENGRWILFSRGNGEFAEYHLLHPNLNRETDIYPLLKVLKGNAIIFNYPAVFGSSRLFPDCPETVKAYRAMMAFLEDKIKGIGAREIIPIGHSIGGSVQGEAFKSHKFKKDIKYVAVKSCSPADLGVIAKQITGIPYVETILKVARWVLSPLESSKTLPIPEIIIHAAVFSDSKRDEDHRYGGYYYRQIHDPHEITSDGMIGKESSLAYAVLSSDCPKDNKFVMGITGLGHMDSYNSEVLGRHIEQMLACPT